MIPILQLKTQYDTIQAELEQAILEALRGTAYINGPDVEAFEQEFSNWLSTPAAVGVGSGTDALHLALRTLELKSDDEVISPAFTFIASASSIALAGAKPVLCDIEPELFNMDPNDLKSRITDKTRAIVVVHLFGHPAPMDEILEIANEHNIAVIEDCAQATGAEYRGQKVGTFGDFGCFSFFPSKNLGGIGDGGMVVAKNLDNLEKIRILKNHGSKTRYYHDVLGTNSRLDTIQAAALRVKLKYIDQWNSDRRRVAARYIEALSGHLPLPIEKEHCRHVFHQFTVQVPDRDRFKSKMEESGIGTMIYYPVSLHQQHAFRSLGYDDLDFPVTREVQSQVLSLPMFPELNNQQVDDISAKVIALLATSSVSA